MERRDSPFGDMEQGYAKRVPGVGVHTTFCTVPIVLASDIGDEILVERCLEPIVARSLDGPRQARSSFAGTVRVSAGPTDASSDLHVPTDDFVSPLVGSSGNDRTRIETELRHQLEGEMLAPMRVSLADSGFVKPGGSVTKMLENLSAIRAHYHRVITEICTDGAENYCPSCAGCRSQS